MSTKTLCYPAQLLCSQREKADETTSSHHKIFDAVEQVPWAELWGFLPADRQLLRHDYLRALEVTHEDMQFRYVVLYEKNRAVGFAYFQIITLEWERIQAERSNGSQKFLNAIRQAAFKTILRPGASVLLQGNIFITGEYGYHTDGLSREKTLRYLLQAARDIRKSSKHIVGTLFKDFEIEDETILSAEGFNRFAVDPNMVLRFPSHWEGMDDYAAAMSSKYRQRMKSAYKKSKKLSVRELRLEEVRAYQVEMHALFDQMIQDDTFNFKQISPTYFIDLKAKLGNAFPVRAYFEGETMVAFYTCLSDRDRMEAHYVGFDLEKNRDFKLYQRMLYDLVAHALEAGARGISFGRTAMEIKSCTGAKAEEYGIFLRIRNPLINKIAGPNIRNIKPNPWQPRHPFKEDYETVTSSKKHSLHLGS